MADKFTRIGAVEGDIWYATTAGGARSAESMEDNIDTELLTWLVEDNIAGSVSSSVAETEIGEVTVTANTARSEIIILASIRFAQTAGLASSGTFRIRTGTNADATLNTNREEFEYTVGAANNTRMGGFIMARVASPSEDFTANFFVTITGQNGVSDAGITCHCEWLVVLAI